MRTSESFPLNCDGVEWGKGGGEPRGSVSMGGMGEAVTEDEDELGVKSSLPRLLNSRFSLSFAPPLFLRRRRRLRLIGHMVKLHCGGAERRDRAGLSPLPPPSAFPYPRLKWPGRKERGKRERRRENIKRACHAASHLPSLSKFGVRPPSSSIRKVQKARSES